jgi:hypothetical protein
MSVIQNFNMNSLSRSKMISLSIPWFIIIVLRNTYNNVLTILDLLYNIIYAYFMSLFIITKIKSYSCLIHGSFKSNNFTMKSIIINFHDYKGIVYVLSSSYKACLIALFRIQVSQFLTTSFTTFLIPGK